MKIGVYLMILFGLPLLGQESVQLRLNLKKGDRYRTTTSTKSASALTKESTNYEILSVKEASDFGFLITLQIDRVLINTSNNGVQVKYDSSKDESQMSASERGLHSRFKPALNTVVSENLSKTGISTNRKKVSGPLNAQMASQKPNVIQLPDEAISVDSMWTHEVINGNIAISYTYLVTEITATKIYLECLGVPKGALKGTVEGTIELDRQTSIPLKKEVKLNLNLNGQVIQSEVIMTTEKL